jgi:hypothetical protein
MATMQKQNDQNKMEDQQRGGQEGGIGSPISNEAYNILSALHNKLEGLEAYRKYSRDGDREIWKEMSDADVKCVERLVDELERLVRDGKLRMSAAGGGGKQGEKPRS